MVVLGVASSLSIILPSPFFHMEYWYVVCEVVFVVVEDACRLVT